MLDALELIALILTAVAMAQSLAHALEFPGKLRLSQDHYFAVQRIYYPGFTYAGVCEPLAIVALAILLALTPSEASEFPLIAGALAAAMATHLLYWLLTAPVNKVWLEGEKLSSTAQRFFGSARDMRASSEWTALRDRWEWSHVYRALTAGIAFLLLAIAVAL